MKANFCEKGDRITYTLFIRFRTQKNKFDVVKMRGVVQKRRETLFLYSFIRFVGYEQPRLFVYSGSPKTNREQKKGNFGNLFPYSYKQNHDLSYE